MALRRGEAKEIAGQEVQGEVGLDVADRQMME